MYFFGGKNLSIGRDIAKFLNFAILKLKAEHYYEPFVGSGGVLYRITPFVNRHASDNHSDLIEMWKAVTQRNWIPPFRVTAKEYEDRYENPDPAWRAFVGYAAAFSSIWSGGYVGFESPKGQPGREEMQARELLRKARSCSNVNFSCNDYRDIRIEHGSVVYADPPYAATGSGYGGLYIRLKHPKGRQKGTWIKFDTEAFWRWVEAISRQSIVFVSECVYPSFMSCIYRKRVKTTAQNNSKVKSGCQKVMFDSLMVHRAWQERIGFKEV